MPAERTLSSWPLHIRMMRALRRIPFSSLIAEPPDAYPTALASWLMMGQRLRSGSLKRQSPLLHAQEVWDIKEDRILHTFVHDLS